MTQFVNRILRASKLDASLYEEMEADKSAAGQSLGVVLLASLAAGVGYVVSGQLIGLVMGTAAALLGWYIWAYMTYFVGAKLFPMPQTSARPGEVLRALGFASAPGLLRVLGVVPGLAGIAFLVAAVWMLVATVIAARQALDYTSTARAVGVCIIGWLMYGLIMLSLLLLFGGG